MARKAVVKAVGTEAEQAEQNFYTATGRRKGSVARVFLFPGEGQSLINNRAMDEYFSVPRLRFVVRRPFAVTGTENQFYVKAKVHGGGIVGQADALKLGIARAMILVNGSFRQALKKNGLLTRDARIKESKKYGRKRARRGFQWTKR